MTPTWMDSAVPALGWVLLHFLWQGAVIGAIAFAGLRALRHAGPQARYALCAAALLACVAVPAAHLIWLMQPSGQWVFAGRDSLPAALRAVLDFLPLLVNAWASGVSLMGLRLVMGLAWVAWLRRRSVPVPAVWKARFESIKQDVGVYRSVALKMLPALDGPIAIGAVRPLVLIPAGLLTRLPVPMIEALLAHELAHVRRWDYLVNLLQSLAEALLFFHPVVWWLSSRMRQEREMVADALAAEALDGGPRRLAEALQALARLDLDTPVSPSRAPALAVPARGGRLLQRIEHLMIKTPHTTSWRLAMPALVLAGASLLVQAGSHDSSAALPADSARTQTGLVTAAPAAPTLPPPEAAEIAPAVPASGLMKLPVNARHMLVIDDAGRVLMAKDAQAVVPIASLTKLMTAMVVLDARQDPREALRIDALDVDLLKHSKSRVPVGATMTRQDALELALLSSENRAASALARHYPGGTFAFEAAVQAKIKALGLTHTTLADPTGLSPTNTSTAAEVARIAIAAGRYPEITRITSGKTGLVAVNGRTRELRNTNHLVGGKGWDIRLSKTGYTNEAGRCLTMRMKSGKQTITVVLLDADGSAQRLRDAALIRKSLARLSAA
ncbi:MAG: M56 family metallopeptidase [Burkholderiaceae bacterium]